VDYRLEDPLVHVPLFNALPAEGIMALREGQTHLINIANTDFEYTIGSGSLYCIVNTEKVRFRLLCWPLYPSSSDFNSCPTVLAPLRARKLHIAQYRLWHGPSLSRLLIASAI
jgi:hypothetical protein